MPACSSGAPEFLNELRGIVPSVRMLTNATRRYADVMNARFGLGFAEQDIFAREDYTYEFGSMSAPLP